VRWLVSAAPSRCPGRERIDYDPSMSGCCDGCEVDTRALATRQRRTLLIVLSINALTFLMMVGASLVSGSSALLSGTLDNLGDAVTYGLSFLVVDASLAAKGRVAFFKGLMILGAAIAVALQIGWRAFHPNVPIVETMGAAAVLNLAANAACLWLLAPYRAGDINMASAWECSRNDVFEGVGVIFTTAAVWAFGSGWPDVIVAAALLALFLRSAMRVLSGARRAMRAATSHTVPRIASPAPGHR
jgi:Co/Zn/Cd efflux system component